MLRLTDTRRRTRPAAPVSEFHDTDTSTTDPVEVPIDCEIARACGLNLLLVGPQGRTEGVIRSLLPPDSATSWQPGEPLHPSEPADILIIRDVDQLPLDDQRRLSIWLAERSADIQVISTASAPLIHAVEEGRFRDDLYYRLNAIYVRC